MSERGGYLLVENVAGTLLSLYALGPTVLMLLNPSGPRVQVAGGSTSRFGVGLMAAIFKFKMAADRGRFLSESVSQKVHLCKIWCFYTDLHDFSLIGCTNE
jgi:hypothetical protein